MLGRQSTCGAAAAFRLLAGRFVSLDALACTSISVGAASILSLLWSAPGCRPIPCTRIQRHLCLIINSHPLTKGGGGVGPSD